MLEALAVVFSPSPSAVFFSQSLSAEPVCIPRIYTRLAPSLSCRDVLTSSESSPGLGNGINPTKTKTLNFSVNTKYYWTSFYGIYILYWLFSLEQIKADSFLIVRSMLWVISSLSFLFFSFSFRNNINERFCVTFRYSSYSDEAVE